VGEGGGGKGRAGGGVWRGGILSAESCVTSSSWKGFNETKMERGVAPPAESVSGFKDARETKLSKT